VLALSALTALVIAASAGGATRTVTFDDLPADTRVSNEYEASHGVTFAASDPWIRPVVKPYPDKAHSGSQVGVYSCEGLPGCGEVFPPPQLRGTLTTSATSVSAYVGYWENPDFPNPGDSFMARILAYNSGDELVAQSSYVTVVSGAPLTQQVTATAPAGERIAYFDVIADAGDGSGGKLLAIDDVAITTPDAPQPPDITLNPGQTIVDVLTGTSVDVPVDINRINGSNGDVSFSVTGLPAGMTAAFNPNPVPARAPARPSPSPPPRAPPTPTSTRRSKSRPPRAPAPARARARSPSWSASARTAIAPCGSPTSTRAVGAAWSDGTATSRPPTPRSGSTAWSSGPPTTPARRWSSIPPTGRSREGS
jgi:hypothetical protein